MPLRKKSGNLFNDPRIYIYIYIYVVMLAKKEDMGNTKRLIEKHIYSSNRNRIKVNLIKQ